MADERSYYGMLGENLARNSAHSTQGPYRTTLNPMQEWKFRQWVRENDVPFQPNRLLQDYDMRGFYSALQSGDPRAQSVVDPHDKQMHYPDFWKTPYHETFSAESQWATPDAPRWQDDRYLVDRDGNVLFDAAKAR